MAEFANPVAEAEGWICDYLLTAEELAENDAEQAAALAGEDDEAFTRTTDAGEADRAARIMCALLEMIGNG